MSNNKERLSGFELRMLENEYNLAIGNKKEFERKNEESYARFMRGTSEGEYTASNFLNTIIFYLILGGIVGVAMLIGAIFNIPI